VQSDATAQRLAKYSRLVFGSKMKQRIVDLVPFQIRKKIGYQLQSFEALGKQLASRGVELDQKELSRIGQFVLDFHQKS
jgi:phage-related protein